MDRILDYFANDDKKVGFTATKAFFNLLGLSWWGKSHFLRKCHEPMAVLILIFHVYGAICYIVNIDVQSSEDFLDMVQLIIFTQTTSFVGFKIFLLHCYKHSIKKAIEATEDLQMQRGIKSNTGFAAKIIRFYVVNITITVIGCLVYGTYIQGYPCKVLYPFDASTNSPIGFSIVWVVQAFGSFYSGAGNGAPDTVILLIVNVMVNFGNELKEILSKIGSNSEEDHKLIREAVEMHIILLELQDKLVRGFRVVLLCQVVFTITHTCVIIFATTKVDDFALIMTSLIPIMIAAYFQLFVFCYSGEILSTMMEDLTFSAYDNQWYNSTVQDRKYLILFMEASLRPVHLHSFGIVKASFETCLNGIRESFSYYVVLKTLDSDLNG